MDKVRFIVVDDQLVARQGLCRLLEADKSLECVGMADSGSEAIKLVEEQWPDVAIVDVAMPNMSGIETTREIKKVHPNISVLIVSAYKYEHYVLACVRAGADGYLLKDKMLAKELNNAVHMVQAGQSVFDSEAADIIHKAVDGKNKLGKGQEGLSSRELDVLKLVASGMTNKEIASKLGISDLTVGAHLANILGKLGVRSRLGAVLYALKKGWIIIDSLDLPSEVTD